MLSAAIDIAFQTESINGIPLLFGSDDVETTITPPASWSDPTQAGTGAVITQSRQSYGTVVFRAAVGSARHKALRGLQVRSRVPGYLGAVYSGFALQLGTTITGRLFPAGGSDMPLGAKTTQVVEFTCHLLDYIEIETPVPGLAI